MTRLETEIAIIGAGLSGLALADALASQGRHVTVFEARDRVGGRILSLPYSSPNHHRYDLGPSWVWPQNRRMLGLIRRLGSTLMEQNATGNLVFQDGNGDMRRDLALATMEGALRVEGGMALIPEQLAKCLPRGVVRFEHRLERVEETGIDVDLKVSTPDGAMSVSAKQVVLALPPRLVASRIDIEPELNEQARAKLMAVPTWMAGQAKLVAVYRRAFWREAGLSGDAISHLGPLSEIHDASPTREPAGEAALFGFVNAHWPKTNPTDHVLKEQAIHQLAALFGPEAGEPVDVHIKDWSRDVYTATSDDHANLAGHPNYRPLSLTGTSGPGRVIISGTETASHDGGFLEGALEAAEIALGSIATFSA